MMRIATTVAAMGLALALMIPLAAPPAALAQAQDWTSYSYPDPGFAVQFPAPPDIQKDIYREIPGQALPMTRYLLRQDGIVFSLEVIDFADTPTDSLAAIAAAEKTFGKAGKVTVAIDARINREFGRELSVTGDDGSRSTVALFFVSGKLVQLVAKALPPNPLARSADAIQFQQSLQFTGQREALGGLDHYSGRGTRPAGG